MSNNQYNNHNNQYNNQYNNHINKYTNKYNFNKNMLNENILNKNKKLIDNFLNVFKYCNNRNPTEIEFEYFINVRIINN